MAQTASTGALTGTVTDASGAAVPNVTVTAVSADSGAVRTATTGSDGSYNLALLPLGNYRVKFEAVGFNTEEVPAVEVKVTETTTLNRALQVGSQTQQVIVQGEAVEAVQTANATLGDVVGGASATALPLTTRNYTNLLGLSSGASASVFNATTLGKGSTDINVNGATIAQNTLQMDGVAIMTTSATGNLTENGNNPGMGYVSPDAMEEFKIQTSLFDAGYGRGPGANVNLVTKSGTNAWHGTAFEFFRNTALNANDFFRNSSLPVNGLPNNSRQVLNQNQFGGVLGGPIKKDKLFVFGSYQGTRQINGAAAQGYSVPQLLPIPDANNRNVSTFASDLGASFCPSGTDGGTSSTVVQVACNGANINPVAIALLQAKNPDGTYLIPSAAGTVGPANATTSGTQATTFTNPAHFTENQVLGNMDYLLNEKNTLALRFFWTTDPTTIPFGCGSGGGLPGICYPDTGLASTLGNIYGVLKLTTIVSNHVVNEARFSIQRSTIVGAVTNPFTASQFGITPLQSAVQFLPQITVAGVFTVGDASNYPVSKFVSNWEAADQVSWTHEKHTVRFGVELERDRYDWHLIGGSATGQINFNNIQDFLLALPGCPGGESASVCAASEALTSPNGTNGSSVSSIANTGTLSGILPPGGLIHGYRTPYGNAFIQDDFKVNQRLTLNLGLRWEYISVAQDSGGFMTNIWTSLINTVPIPGNSPATGTLAGWVVPSNWNQSQNAVPPVGGLYQNTNKTFRMGNTPLDDFAPRLGFAYSPFSSNRFVLRGGAGYFYDKTGNANYNSGYEQNEPYSISAFGSGTAIAPSTFACPFFAPSSTSSCAVPPLGWTPRWVNFGATGTNAGFTSSNLSIASTQQNYWVPVTYQWNLNAQYEFAHNWTLELGYVGSRAFHQPGIQTSRQINEAQLVGNPLGTNTVTAPAIANGLVTTNTVANAVLRVPYLGFAPSGMLLTGDESAFKYNSIQATVRKQFTHNFQMQGAYTYARSFVTEPSFNDPNVQFYSLNPQYHPQRLAVSYLWILPLGTHQGLLGKLTSGWGWSGVTILQNGTPLTAVDNRGGAIFGLQGGSNIVSTAEYCSGTNASMAASPGSTQQRLGGRYSADGWFNPTTFSKSCAVPVVPGTNGTGWGDSSVAILLGPGQFNWDMSLTKTTTVGGIREGATLTFRTEFFNTFNHPQFNNPAASGGIAGTSNVNSSTFGQITSTSVNPRLIQFALRYAF
ncbi:MAG: carboxypeptidase-like regulatory domain-containing protein [Candidatus Acidiferrales bacterium]